MILISHRGNILGKALDRENTVDYIVECLRKGFSVEVDVHRLDNEFLCLGHDAPNLDQIIDESFLEDPRIFVHCKNEDAFEYLSKNPNIQCFFQDDENEVFVENGSSRSLIWNHSENKTVSKNRILVFLGTYEEFKEVYKTGIVPYGICTDHPMSFKIGLEKELNFDNKIESKKSLKDFVKEIENLKEDIE